MFYIILNKNIKIGSNIETANSYSKDDYMNNMDCFGIKYEDAYNLFLKEQNLTDNKIFNFLTRFLYWFIFV